MTQTIDFTPSLPDQVFTTQWGSLSIQIEAHWNAIGGIWTATLTRMDSGAVIVPGMPLVLGLDLLYPYKLGLGSVIGINAVDGTNPTLDNLGTAVIFYWVDQNV